MASSDEDQNYSADGLGGLSPLVLIVPALLIGAAAFLLARRNNNSTARQASETARETARETAQEVSKKGGSATRRAAIGLLITALENDAARRVVITGLKIARSRV